MSRINYLVTHSIFFNIFYKIYILFTEEIRCLGKQIRGRFLYFKQKVTKDQCTNCQEVAPTNQSGLTLGTQG